MDGILQEEWLKFEICSMHCLKVEPKEAKGGRQNAFSRKCSFPKNVPPLIFSFSWQVLKLCPRLVSHVLRTNLILLELTNTYFWLER